MTGFVFVLSIGPVQPFIAAARRTRDLWQGSAMLSALAAAGAGELRAQGAELIFPHAGSVPNLPSAPQSAGLASISAAGVSNKIVGCLPAGASPAAVAVSVKAEVLKALRGLGDDCLTELQRTHCLGAIDTDLFKVQLGQVLECFCAWSELASDDDNDNDKAYLAAFTSAQRALDARKRLRDFTPSASARVGLPLSSLDATAESVLTGAGPDRRLRLIHGIDSTEGLDAFGLIKRVLGDAKGFPAVTRVALQPWIASWSDAQVRAVDGLLTPVAKYQLASQNKCGPGDPMNRLNWDAELLLTGRRNKWQAKADEHAHALDLPPQRLVDALKALHDALSTGDNRPPLPAEDGVYVAVLLADGDRMGECITRVGQGRSGHQGLSEALAGFAGNASVIVGQHGGACLYSGGDDVLALVAVAEAPACARALAEDFAARIGPHAQERATLSVGLAFVHVLMSFEQSRALAAAALQLAKQGLDGKGLRNALGLVVQPRNGEAVELSGRWDADNGTSTPAGFDRRLAAWRGAFERGALAKGAPYDLRTLIDRVPAGLLPDEARRLLQRRQNKVDKVLPELLAHVFNTQPQGGSDRKSLRALEREWYVGRWLAAHAGPSATASAPVQVGSEVEPHQVSGAEEPAA